MEKKPVFGGRKIYTEEEFVDLLEEAYQNRIKMMENPPMLDFLFVYTVTDLGGGNLDVQWEAKVVVKGQHALYGCPFIIRYLSYFHGKH